MHAAERQPSGQTVPMDVVKIVLEFLLAPDLARAACVCRSWYLLSEMMDYVWDLHVLRDWNISARAFRPLVFFAKKDDEFSHASKDALLTFSLKCVYSPRPLSKHLYEKMHSSWRNLGSGLVSSVGG